MPLHVLAACWAIGPPIWFIVEWTFFGPNASDFETFKYSQETAKDVWAGVAAVLALIIVKHDS